MQSYEKHIVYLNKLLQAGRTRGMEVYLTNKNVFPSEVRELLNAFFLVGFFKESLRIGSWVMPLYRKLSVFLISYERWT